MSVSRQPQITEELLSAYLDDQVTDEERTLIEEAIATDPVIAWQVDSLRQTVHLLQALPSLALPRTFTLEAILAEARAAEAPALHQPEVVVSKTSAPRRTAVTTPVAAELENNWWQWFLQLWQGGNLHLRNAAAVAFTLFFVLFAGNRLLVSTSSVTEVTSINAPVVLTSEERITAKPPGALATVEPTPTSAPATVTANSATNRNDQANDQAASGAEENTTANALANTSAQSEGATLAAPRGAPGPVEEDLTGGGAGTDSPAVESFRAPENSERTVLAKATVAISDAVAANASVTQQASIASVAASVNESVTTTEVISETYDMTSSVTITPTVLPTLTIDSDAPLAVETPNANPDFAWLNWAQMIAALSTVVLAGLWWRSRR